MDSVRAQLARRAVHAPQRHVVAERGDHRVAAWRPSLSLAAELCGHGVRHDGERPGGPATKGLAEHGSAMVHEVAISG
eukprot:scaffold76056_cov70-Phaeocystis_antarctica.AAC.8